MNKLISVVIASVLIVGCQSQEELDKIALKNKNDVMVKSCISKLRVNLKDPDSMKIVTTPLVFMKGEQEMVGFTYNAKNSYGGYTGMESFFCEFDKTGTIISAN
jgi:uncharacterized protein YcfL